jgi:hypothetical protein
MTVAPKKAPKQKQKETQFKEQGAEGCALDLWDVNLAEDSDSNVEMGDLRGEEAILGFEVDRSEQVSILIVALTFIKI